MTSYNDSAISMPLDEYYEKCVNPKMKIPKKYGFAKKQRKAAHLQSYKDEVDDEENDDEDEYEEDERTQVDELSPSKIDSNQIQVEFENDEFNQVYEDTDDPMGQNDKNVNEGMPANSAQWRIYPNNINRPVGAPPLVPKNARRDNSKMQQQLSRRKRFWNYGNNKNNNNNRPSNYRNNKNNNDNHNNSRISVHHRLGYNMKQNWPRGQQHMPNNSSLNTKTQLINTINYNNNNNKPQMQEQQVLLNTHNEFNTNQQPNNNNNYNQQQQMSQLLLKLSNQVNTNQPNNNVQQQQATLMNLNNQLQNGNSQLNVSYPLSSIETNNRRNNVPVYYQNNNRTNTDTLTSLISLANSNCTNQGNINNNPIQINRPNNYPAQNRLGLVTRACSNESALGNAGYAQHQTNPINQTNQFQSVSSDSGGVVASETVRLADLVNITRDDDQAFNIRELATNAIYFLNQIVHKPVLNMGVQQEMSNMQQKNPTGLDMSIKPQVTGYPMARRFT